MSNLMTTLFPEATSEDLALITRLAAEDVPASSAPQPVRTGTHGVLENSQVLAGSSSVPFARATAALVLPGLRWLIDCIKHSTRVAEPARLSRTLAAACIDACAAVTLRSQTEFMARRRGHLTGATAEDRYEEFYTWLSSEQGTRSFGEEYPLAVVAARAAARNYVSEIEEILCRYHGDRESLVADGLLPHASDISGIDLGQGDAHEGRTVAQVTLADGGVIVYKPRPLGLEKGYQRPVSALAARMGATTLRAPKVTARAGYGWMEFIEAVPAESVEHACLALGELLGVMHVLCATDLHHENIVMQGGTPVPVDLERCSPRCRSSMTTSTLRPVRQR